VIVTTSFIVAATPRTGSTLLCEGLESTGIAGRPGEFFAPDFRVFWCRHWSMPEDASFETYLVAARSYGTTPNGVYGLKIQQGHVSDLAREASFVGEHFGGDNDDVLEYLFPGSQYVNLVRRDRRAQAISFYRALATNEWVKRPTEDEQRLVFQLPRPEAPLAFDANAIRDLEEQLARQQDAWERYFFKRAIAPLVIEYEALVQDYEGQIARTLEFLSLDASVAQTLPSPRTVRQADEHTAAWRVRLDHA
jgi:trehalose 2-sulfotransferase